jgi:nitroreductase
LNPRLNTLLTAASLAPSGDNLQPWRFLVDPLAGTITLEVNDSRDRSPMNAGQLMARVAVGAALENLLRTAARNGWEAVLEPARLSAVARVRCSGQPEQPGEIENAIPDRVTNRRFYDGHLLKGAVLDRLARETPPLDGTSAHWIVNRDRLVSLAKLIGTADALMFTQPSMRTAFLSNVRFDVPAGAKATEGLPLASLEATLSDRIALRAMRWTPNWVVKSAMKPLFATRARQLVESASGLCLVVAPDDSEAGYTTVGRVMQKAWLALTGEGLAVQPMMSLPVLATILDHGSSDLVASLKHDGLPALQEAFRKAVPELGAGRPGFLLRFGQAAPPSGRTGRLPLAEQVTIEGDSSK